MGGAAIEGQAVGHRPRIEVERQRAFVQVGGVERRGSRSRGRGGNEGRTHKGNSRTHIKVISRVLGKVLEGVHIAIRGRHRDGIAPVGGRSAWHTKHLVRQVIRVAGIPAQLDFVADAIVVSNVVGGCRRDVLRAVGVGPSGFIQVGEGGLGDEIKLEQRRRICTCIGYCSPSRRAIFVNAIEHGQTIGAEWRIDQIILVLFLELHQEVFLAAVGVGRTESDFHRLAMGIEENAGNKLSVGHA